MDGYPLSHFNGKPYPSTYYGTPEGTRLHFCLWRKLRFGSVEPSPATVPRTVAFDCSSPLPFGSKKATPLGDFATNASDVTRQHFPFRRKGK